MTAMSGSSRQLTLKKGAPEDQVWDLLYLQLASYQGVGTLMWMTPLHLHINQKSDYDDDIRWFRQMPAEQKLQCFQKKG